MATINLRDYHHRIDALLDREDFEQAAAHCRHILQHLPKNVATYTLLGQALLHGNQNDAAAVIFQRVLGANPVDQVAHIGLSEIYEKKATSTPRSGTWSGFLIRTHAIRMC
ncbi:MAG: tetratricopeptide repeat protein [Anaerolineae bacterium]|nr:tetratricopeptide repeat protein [Anaerolineae bacterium]